MRRISFLMKEEVAQKMDDFLRKNTGVNNMSGALNFILDRYFSTPKEHIEILDRLDAMEKKLSVEIHQIDNASYQILERVIKLHLFFSFLSSNDDLLDIDDDIKNELRDIYLSEKTTELITKRMDLIRGFE